MLSTEYAADARIKTEVRVAFLSVKAEGGIMSAVLGVNRVFMGKKQA